MSLRLKRQSNGRAAVFVTCLNAVSRSATT